MCYIHAGPLLFIDFYKVIPRCSDMLTKHNKKAEKRGILKDNGT